MKRVSGFYTQSIVTIAALALVISACSRKEETLPGERLELRAQLAQQSTDEQAAQEIEAQAERAAFVASEQVANAAWTHRNGSPAHSIQHPRFAASPQLFWARNVGSGNKRRLRVSSDPVIADGRVFALDAANQVQAFSTAGAPLWSRSLTAVSDPRDTAPGGGLAISGDLLVATSGFGEVVVMDAASGAVRWRQRMPASLSAPPVIAGETIIAVTRSNLTYGLNIANGRIRWQIQGPEVGAGVLGGGAPAIAGGLAILPYSTGEVVAVVPRNGVSAWSQKISGRRIGAARSFVSGVSSDPVAIGNTVYFGTQAGRLAAVDRRSGERKWTAKEGALGPVWPEGNAIFMVTDEYKVKRLNAATGAPVWSVELPKFKREKKRKGQYAHYGPILAGGALWVAGGDGLLRKFSPETGAELGSVDIPSGAASHPAVAGGVMYMMSQKGQLLAYR